MIHAEHQRRDLGSEALDGLVRRLQARGRRAMRVGVIERNPAGRAFTEQAGFQPVSTTVMRMTSSEVVIVLERPLFE